MIALTAPTRLHFGLIHVPSSGEPAMPGVSHFGGLGLMLRSPGISIAVETADEWNATGPTAERALAFARRVAAQFPVEVQRPLRIAVETCPPEHVGLGVGTQLGLAIADATARELLGKIMDVEELARLAGRGERSRIGVGGYRGGGFLWDAGHKSDSSEATSIAGRESWPIDWRIVLIRPRGACRWHGDRERSAFARPRDPEECVRGAERLSRLAQTGVLPALLARDLAAFGESLHEFNRLAGEPFAADQGGPYGDSAVTAAISELRAHGIRCVGQSSWGPTIFAIVAEPWGMLRLAAILPELATVQSAKAFRPSE